MINFGKQLQQSGLKSTIQRVSMLEVIEELGHASIDDIYHKVKEKFATISLNTVHTNVHALLEANLISKISLDKQKAVYELLRPDFEHLHMICEECGAIIDYMDMDSTQQVYDKLKRMITSEQFLIEKTSIVLYGKCAHCANAMSIHRQKAVSTG